MAKKDDKNKGAMGKDPSLPKTSARGNWKYKGKWVNKDGFLVDNYGKVLPNQKQPFVAAANNPFAKKDTKPPPGTTPPGNKKPSPPPVEQVVDDSFRQGAGAYKNIVDQFNKFDPNTVQSNYQPQFTDAMNQARDSMMGQFERRNADLFARERLQTEQNIVERGLDPNSPAAKQMMQELNDRQDRARQEAMNAAETQAYNVQQQGYNQATGLAMMPYEQFNAIQAPLAAGMQNQYSQQQLGQQFGYEQKLNEQKFRHQQQLQKSQRRGSGSGTNPNDEAFANTVINKY